MYFAWLCVTTISVVPNWRISHINVTLRLNYQTELK